MMFNAIKYIHLIGVGGSGMSGIAEVLLHCGYHVSGSDLKASAITEHLSKLGGKIFIGHDATQLGNAQVVVVSSAVNKHNPEWIEAHNRKIPVIHRSEMLAELMRLKYGIIIAGTHGKTTTTSLISTVLHECGFDPTVIIGGKLNSFNSNSLVGKGELFVAEADESDGSFLRLNPTVAVLTNVDKDHLDFYGSFDNILNAFKNFLDRVPFYGAIIACSDDPGVQLILPKIRRKIITYGLRPDADITARSLSFDGMNCHFTPVAFGKEYPSVTLKMPGAYNVTNSLACFALAVLLELDLNRVGHALDAFKGVEHRFSVLRNEKTLMVIDDYAHNPVKIQAVLNGARQGFQGHHICAVFQPHRYTRLKAQWDEFTRSFQCADSVIVCPIYSAGEEAIEGVTPQAIAQAIVHESFANDQEHVFTVSHLKRLCAKVQDIRQKTDAPLLVITLGAGDIKYAAQDLSENLK